jgi:hypothetical protein
MKDNRRGRKKRSRHAALILPNSLATPLSDRRCNSTFSAVDIFSRKKLLINLMNRFVNEFLAKGLPCIFVALSSTQSFTNHPKIQRFFWGPNSSNLRIAVRNMKSQRNSYFDTLPALSVVLGTHNLAWSYILDFDRYRKSTLAPVVISSKYSALKKLGPVLRSDLVQWARS